MISAHKRNGIVSCRLDSCVTVSLLAAAGVAALTLHAAGGAGDFNALAVASPAVNQLGEAMHLPWRLSCKMQPFGVADTWWLFDLFAWGSCASASAGSCPLMTASSKACAGSATLYIYPTCAHSLRGRFPYGTHESKGDAYCAQVLQPGSFADSQRFYRLDGGIPTHLVGSLHVQFPHQVDDVPVRYRVEVDAAASDASPLLAVWYNNDSSFYRRYADMVHGGWSAEDTAYCAAELPSTLARGGFVLQAGSPGVPYDAHAVVDPSHGLPSALWERELSVGGAAEMSIGRAPSGWSCQQTVGLAVSGACHLTIRREQCSDPHGASREPVA
mmetsp:Transcript_49898/g.161160  ORF Transcript_49898/g.161160 Transcript_49898/m.161160 type:complete len:329 (+) Transcript_49898:121-1107(+)